MEVLIGKWNFLADHVCRRIVKDVQTLAKTIISLLSLHVVSAYVQSIIHRKNIQCARDFSFVLGLWPKMDPCIKGEMYQRAMVMGCFEFAATVWTQNRVLPEHLEKPVCVSRIWNWPNWHSSLYPAANKHGNGKSTMNGGFIWKITDTWSIFHYHVWLLEGKCLKDPLKSRHSTPGRVPLWVEQLAESGLAFCWWGHPNDRTCWLIPRHQKWDRKQGMHRDVQMVLHIPSAKKTQVPPSCHTHIFRTTVSSRIAMTN